MSHTVSRRTFLSTFALGASSMTLAACSSSRFDNTLQTILPAQPKNDGLSSYAAMYASRKDGNFTLPAIPYKKIDPQFLRQIVDDPTGEIPGTIVVDTKRRYLYLVRKNGKAIRYGVGIGKAGFSWSGRATIQYKKQWPTWTPPAEMIQRQPQLEKYSARNGGMQPGLTNPLGARALYIFQNGKDTLYRLHGSPEWWSIGKNVSSGCVRLMNQDIIDLYERVPEKTPILVV